MFLVPSAKAVLVTVLVSHNITFFGLLVPMSHGVNKKTYPSASPPPLPPTSFSPGLFDVLEEMLNQTPFTAIRLFAKDNTFSKKIRFFLYLIPGRFWFRRFVYMFFTAFSLQFCYYKIRNQKLLLFFWFPGKLILRLILPL